MASGDYNATVGGGESNIAGADHATVGGGKENQAISGTYTTVAGGWGNTASGWSAAIGGGRNNTSSDDATTVSGGYLNTASDIFATVGGGRRNTASGAYATASGGYSNTVSGLYYATVAGGYGNVASGDYYATVGGGEANIASGNHATVPGGNSAAATHYGEMAYASGSFAHIGDAQTSIYVMRGITDTSGTIELFLDGSGERITLPISRTVAFDILITASAEDGDAASWHIVGLIRRDGFLDPELIGTSPSTPALPAISTVGAGAWEVHVDADGENDALRILVSSGESSTVRWVASVRTAETNMP